MNPTLTILTALLLSPLAELHAADTAIQLTPAHHAAVDHQRRIFFYRAQIGVRMEVVRDVFLCEDRRRNGCVHGSKQSEN